jgi:uncharacterized phage protein (TIGR01671 family)
MGERGGRMRVPKFRAWDEDSQKMNGNVEIYINKDKTIEVHPKDNKTIVMQSTGLKDKNGKEIFEGDIVVAMSQGVKAIGEVKRRIDGYWLMYPAWQHGEFWNIVKDVDTGETGVEIIGNIYENPELLEGE